jgi:glycogen(starch) synthase
VPDHARRGIYVVDRHHQDTDRTIEELTQILVDFCRLDRRERIQLRNRTERLSELLDWANLAHSYAEAHELALSRTYEAVQSET